LTPIDFELLSVHSSALIVAEKVVQKADHAHPADSVLRLELKRHAGLSRLQAAQASRIVFSYYRWQRWLDAATPLREQLMEALRLAQRFADDPQSISGPDLISRAVPDWIREDIDFDADLCRKLQSEPTLWLRARPGQGTSLAKRLRHCHAFGPGPLSDTLAYVGREDLFRTPEFHAGEFELQDISSQAVGLVCAPRPGETWWDACAGEGGKMLHLADLMGNQGLIWATDRAGWRLDRLKRRTARARVFNYRKALWDGEKKLPTKTKFDGILVDAPCTGTGTWQRNPDARWTLSPQDLKELAQLQMRLLVHAAAGLKPGGKLIYSVCSLTRSETVEVVESFGRLVPDLIMMPIVNPLVPGSKEAAHLWLRPNQFGGNGMFIAAWLRPR
jgi:16S rRNA (cytosine967-C5)-methyltransferase